ncbi:MAG: phenylalanine 4-monooxygenase [Ignavibacteriaceae bacterium]|nr:phenylalanine 4-monooxygenase [Ignavibacteriaceae bacterium]
MSDEKILSAYAKAAEQGIDPRCIPQKLNGPVPEDNQIIYPDYPESDQESWRFLFHRQMQFLPGRVCNEYLTGSEKLKFTPDKIPALKDLSAVFKKTTGWKIARVPGLIDEQDFFELLRRRVFPSTDYIRGKNELDYTPAPDLFHDMFGHMPLLTDPNFASFYQMFGEAAFNAKGIQRKWLETFHWFTVEFGLINKPDGMRIYGAGIISSLGEVQHALSNEVEIKPFDVKKLINQPYDVWHVQPTLFAINSFEHLENEFKNWTKKEGLIT